MSSPHESSAARDAPPTHDQPFERETAPTRHTEVHKEEPADVSMAQDQPQPSAEAQQSSTSFYTNLGYPQYAGKYAPISVPQGAKVTSLTETSQGLQASFTFDTLEDYQRYLYAQNFPQGKAPDGTPISFAQYQQMLNEPSAVDVFSTVGSGVLPLVITALAPPLGVAGLAGLGVSEAVSEATTQKPLTVEQAEQSILASEILGAASLGVGAVASEAIPSVAESMLGKTAIQAGVGGVANYIMSGGQPEQALIGMGLGAGIGLGAEAIPELIGVPKFGTAEIPLESRITEPIPEEGIFAGLPEEAPEPVKWTGIYWQRGAEAYPIIGKLSGLDDAEEQARILSHGLSGEEAGWIPETPLESKVTLRTMEELGYAPEEIQTAEDVLGLMKLTKGVRSQYISEWLPEETQTLSKAGVSALKDFILGSKEDVYELYGSFGTRAQLEEGAAEYVLDTGKEAVSGLRTPADIDVMLKEMEPEHAAEFAKNLSEELGRVGETVRISPESPTLIEALSEAGTWRHAVDIHFEGEPLQDVLTPTTEGAWGYKFAEKPLEIENLPTMPASEQALRKGASVLGFTAEDTFAPVTHRMKDIVDFLQVENTLADSMRMSDPAAKQTIADLAEHFGVENLQADDITPERIIVSPTAKVPADINADLLDTTSTGAIFSQARFRSFSAGIENTSKSLSTSLSKTILSTRTSIPSVKTKISKGASGRISKDLSTKISELSASPSLEISPIISSILSRKTSPYPSQYPSLKTDMEQLSKQIASQQSQQAKARRATLTKRLAAEQVRFEYPVLSELEIPSFLKIGLPRITTLSSASKFILTQRGNNGNVSKKNKRK